MAHAMHLVSSASTSVAAGGRADLLPAGEFQYSACSSTLWFARLQHPRSCSLNLDISTRPSFRRGQPGGLSVLRSSLSSSGPSGMATLVLVKPGVELKVFESVDKLAEDLAHHVVELSAAAVKERRAFSAVLSGGSLISTLGKLTEEPYVGQVDWARWHVFWVDERVVKLDHPDSNYKLAQDGLLSKVPIPAGQVYAINDALSPAEAAEDYETGLRHLVTTNVLPVSEGYPRFDLILLGMGPDGHVASLFPNHPLVSVKDKWVVSITDSPKPPPERITFTLPVINNAAHIAFVATGSGKAEKVKQIFGPEVPYGSLPAQLVSPVQGKLVWFADQAATSAL